jgi:hypothetical protein
MNCLKSIIHLTLIVIILNRKEIKGEQREEKGEGEEYQPCYPGTPTEMLSEK